MFRFQLFTAPATERRVALYNGGKWLGGKLLLYLSKRLPDALSKSHTRPVMD